MCPRPTFLLKKEMRRDGDPTLATAGRTWCNSKYEGTSVDIEAWHLPGQYNQDPKLPPLTTSDLHGRERHTQRAVNHSRASGRKLKDWRTQIFLFLLADDYDFERERGIFMYTLPTCVRCTLYRANTLSVKLPKSFQSLTLFIDVATRAQGSNLPEAAWLVRNRGNSRRF